MSDQERRIHSFIEARWGHETDGQRISKLCEETRELLDALEAGNKENFVEEAADVVIVLTHYLARHGVSLTNAIRAKLAKMGEEGKGRGEAVTGGG